MSENPLQKAEKKALTIREQVDAPDFLEKIKTALPAHLTPGRFQRIVITAIAKNPKLAQCSALTFFTCVMSLATLGIEPDGRRAHLVPRWNSKKNAYDCTYVIDYKGLVELATNHGTISNIHADVVCENDQFDYDTGQVKCHKIDFRKPRGEAFAAYCIITFKDGSTRADVMSREDVEKCRARSASPNDGPWVSDWNEMAKKSVFRRLSKWLPMSPEYRDAIELEDDQNPINEPKELPKPVFRALPEPKRPEMPEPSEPQAEQETENESTM